MIQQQQHISISLPSKSKPNFNEPLTPCTEISVEHQIALPVSKGNEMTYGSSAKPNTFYSKNEPLSFSRALCLFILRWLSSRATSRINIHRLIEIDVNSVARVISICRMSRYYCGPSLLPDGFGGRNKGCVNGFIWTINWISILAGRRLIVDLRLRETEGEREREREVRLGGLLCHDVSVSWWWLAWRFNTRLSW